MKILRCLTQDSREITASPNADQSLAVLQGDWSSGFAATGENLPVEQVQKWLSPVSPPQIWAAGLNYRKHAEEVGMKPPQFPVIFAKGVNAACGHENEVSLPSGKLISTKVDWECELAIVIGRRAKNLTRENALEHVFGYTCANDVSARDWQMEWGGSQWIRGKSFDGFCPLGPWIVTSDEIGDPQQLRIQTRVNGETVQDSFTSDFIFDIPTLLEFLSADTTLLPGTVILTGTPAGVGTGLKPQRFLAKGDTVEVEIERIGVLRNRFV